MNPETYRQTLAALRLYAAFLDNPLTIKASDFDTIPPLIADWTASALNATFHYLGGSGRLSDALAAHALSHFEIREIAALAISSFTLLEPPPCK